MEKNKIREKRMALGLSQVQLGFLSGVANSVISDFELAKRTPWPKARKALARALKIPEAELFPPEE
jgi:transcriptional regulator with XRE-family HTH domain